MAIPLVLSCQHVTEFYTETGNIASIFPDYRDVIIPPNIAPLNFMLELNADRYFFRVESANGYSYNSKGKSNNLIIPVKQWEKLLQNSTKLSYSIFFKKEGDWYRLATFQNIVSTDYIDSYLTYRLFTPSFQVIKKVGIYRRNLENFKERTLVETSYENLCFNCHVYASNDSRIAMFHTRESEIGGTVIIKNGSVCRIEAKASNMINSATYPNWHPSGNYIAFSANRVDQVFYSSQNQRDAYDVSSDLVIYDLDNNTFLSDANVYGKEYLESYPCWDNKGEYIYFSRADYSYYDSAKTIFDVHKLTNVKYSLMRIKFNFHTGTFSTPECLVNGDSLGKSIVIPKVSPDGRYVLCSVSEYGNFPLFHKESELWIFDIKNLSFTRLDNINSEHAEGYHNWSKNGKWIVFSSKALNGIHTTTWICSFRNGLTGKPFIIPQKKPDYYNTFIRSYTVPEFTTNDYCVGKSALYKVVNSKEKTIPVIQLPDSTY